MWKSFYFGGESSAEHGLFITGEAVYDAPQYDYEFVEIQGRNGDLVLDNGRFKNITVTYPCGVADVSKLAEIRTWLYSKRGYQRLSDDYNANEYRLGVVSENLDVTPFNNHLANFTVTFNCKPQRFLTSGEEGTQFAPIYTDGSLFFTAWLEIADTLEENYVKQLTGDMSSFYGLQYRTANGTATTRTKAQLSSYITGDVLDLKAAGILRGTSGYVKFIFTQSPNGFEYLNYAEGETAEPINITDSISIENPTAYDASPLLEIRTGNVGETANISIPEITIGGVTVSVSGMRGTLYIDTDIQDCYIEDNGEYINGNSYVTLTKEQEATTDFPKIPAGSTTISPLYTGTVSSYDANLGMAVITIYPRYWTI
jgi:phage-related protein